MTDHPDDMEAMVRRVLAMGERVRGLVAQLDKSERAAPPVAYTTPPSVALTEPAQNDNRGARK